MNRAVIRGLFSVLETLAFHGSVGLVIPTLCKSSVARKALKLQ